MKPIKRLWGWIVDFTCRPPKWVAHGDRDIRCALCQVPKQAHTRELHVFIFPRE